MRCTLLYDKLQQVSSLLNVHKRERNSIKYEVQVIENDKYEVLVKKQLRSTLDVGSLLCSRF